ncbi:DNA-directed RNA polymerase subunit D [archaeon]|nr:DNA-directed RNA polymerase subunit D [archaeon]|tara:strand:- start:3481 stop:4248 length:768 start_codon:yes stop_codon:yes gene_type:complete
MEIKVLNKEEEKVSFILKKINPVIANTIRRTVMEEVPVLAIEDITFNKNSSALFDEVVAHRLGLVPLVTDLKSYNLSDDCKCKGKGCAMCQVKFKLDVKDEEVVYASDLVFNDSKVKAVYGKMPIVTLSKKQEVVLEGVAELGKGKEHSKWCPGLVYYREYPEIDAKKGNEEAFKVCPKDVFEFKGKLSVKNLENCDLCNACTEVSDVEVKGKKDEFIFFVESFGQLSCKEILVQATEKFDKKLDEFEKELSKLK